MKTLSRSHYARVFFSLVLGVLLGISGCSTVHLRDAQEAVKKGTQLEWSNFYSLDQDIEPTLITQETAQQKYKEALGIIDELLKDDSKQLAADNLLGTTLLLRAICIWKIEPDKPVLSEETDPSMANKEWIDYRVQWQMALTSAVRAASDAGLSTEQQRLADALPSFLISDLTYDRIAEYTRCNMISKPVLDEIVTDLISGEHSVIKKLRALEQEVTPDNSANSIQKEMTTKELPWCLYLIEAQLIVFMNYHAALNRVCTDRPTDRYKGDLIATWERYCETVDTLPDKEAGIRRARILRKGLTNKSSYDREIKICP